MIIQPNFLPSRFSLVCSAKKLYLRDHSFRIGPSYLPICVNNVNICSYFMFGRPLVIDPLPNMGTHDCIAGQSTNLCISPELAVRCSDNIDSRRDDRDAQVINSSQIYDDPRFIRFCKTLFDALLLSYICVAMTYRGTLQYVIFLRLPVDDILLVLCGVWWYSGKCDRSEAIMLTLALIIQRNAVSVNI